MRTKIAGEIAGRRRSCRCRRLRWHVAKCGVRVRLILVTSVLFSHGLIRATTLPASEQLVLQLDTKISSRCSRTGDFLQASIMLEADRSPQFLLLSGAIAEGRIEKAGLGEPILQHATVQIRCFRIRFGLESPATKLPKGDTQRCRKYGRRGQ